MNQGTTLAVLVTDPTRVDSVAPNEIPGLLGELEALKARLWVRLQAGASTATPAPTKATEPDQLLTAQQAADRLGTTKRWVYSHADALPFTKRLTSGTVRFSSRGLERWKETRAA